MHVIYAKRGRSHYKLNTNFVKDENHILEIKRFHESAKNDPTYINLNSHMTWELIKAEIKSISQQFSKTAQLKKYNDSHALRSTLETIEKEFVIDPKARTIQEERLKLKRN